MRLLITTDTVGGVWSFGLELAKGVLQVGDSVALVSFGAPAAAAQAAECENLRTEWNEHFEFIDTGMPLEWMQENERCLERGAEVLQRIAQSFGAELLHCNQFCYGAAMLGIPTVITAHSDVFSWGRSCGQPLAPSNWLSRYRQLVQSGLDRADAVAAPTPWMLKALRQEFSFNCPAKVIPNGCSMRTPRPGNRQLRAVTAGRLWDRGKGLSVLHALPSPMPIAIAGETHYGDVAVEVPEGVAICGALQREELLQLFAESAVYLCTSLYEPFGLAALEAAMCGCAVVARDVPSLREVWGDAASYFQNAEELSLLLHSFYEDPRKLQTARALAWHHAQRYTREAMVQRYRELYVCVMNGEDTRVA